MTDFNQIAKKWQDRWEKEKIFEVEEDPKKKQNKLSSKLPTCHLFCQMQ